MSTVVGVRFARSVPDPSEQTRVGTRFLARAPVAIRAVVAAAGRQRTTTDRTAGAIGLTGAAALARPPTSPRLARELGFSHGSVASSRALRCIRRV
jgi:hypothetical protein